MIPRSLETDRLPADKPADPAFPHAPWDWWRGSAEETATVEGFNLTGDHFETIRCLQDYFARHEQVPYINMRELHDALDEHFHTRGGLKELYRLFPGGPIAQGCRLAGLKAPSVAMDVGSGSVA